MAYMTNPILYSVDVPYFFTLKCSYYKSTRFFVRLPYRCCTLIARITIMLILQHKVRIMELLSHFPPLLVWTMVFDMFRSEWGQRTKSRSHTLVRTHTRSDFLVHNSDCHRSNKVVRSREDVGPRHKCPIMYFFKNF
jgi:hypothetical protein